MGCRCLVFSDHRHTAEGEHDYCQGLTEVIRVSPWSCPGVLPRSTFPHGDVLRWVERLIRPCLRKLVGRWVGPNSSANTHSKIILTIPVSARGYQTGDEQGTSLGLSFAHERLRHSHRRKMNCLLFFNCNFLCEWSPPGSAAREPHRKPGGEQLSYLFSKQALENHDKL